MALYGPSLAQGLGSGLTAPAARGDNRMLAMLASSPWVQMMGASQRNPAQDALSRASATQLPTLLRRLGAPNMPYRTHSKSAVVSPGQTQVIRPSQQQPARRAAAPQAGAASSLITSTPSPAEVALATTSLLGG